MPELPEVETTLRGIEPYLKDQKISQIIIRHPRLRWPIPKEIVPLLKNSMIQSVTRRAKYLLIETAKGTLILHLGMSGSLRVLKAEKPPQKHDHFDIILASGIILRYTDPRRFGALLFTSKDPLQHTLLKELGPEPLSSQLTGKYLYERAQSRKVALKVFIMDSKVVVGVGNIYASEALFAAHLNPHLPVHTVSREQFTTLVTEIKKVLRAAIKQGGTTLKDFSHGEGKPGYFKQQLNVYGRGGLPCVRCKTPLAEDRLGQRSTVFCLHCQPI